LQFATQSDGRDGLSPVYREGRRGMHVAPARPMTDLILVAVTIGFFALSIAYTRGCDRL